MNDTLLDDLEKCSLFSDFWYGFRSSRSTGDLLRYVSNKIARAFNRSGANRAAMLDISKAFYRVWHAGLLHKLTSYGTSRQIFSLTPNLGGFFRDLSCAGWEGDGYARNLKFGM